MIYKGPDDRREVKSEPWGVSPGGTWTVQETVGSGRPRCCGDLLPWRTSPGVLCRLWFNLLSLRNVSSHKPPLSLFPLIFFLLFLFLPLPLTRASLGSPGSPAASR